MILNLSPTSDSHSLVISEKIKESMCLINMSKSGRYLCEMIKTKSSLHGAIITMASTLNRKYIQFVVDMSLISSGLQPDWPSLLARTNETRARFGTGL